jgi:ribose/xylose/arabinose/galactoside ABC-type transport system permease subunit
MMFAIFSIFANNFFTVRSVLNLLVQTSTFAILGIGAALVLVVGGIDFSLGAVIAFSGTAVLMFARTGMPIWAAMTMACMVCGVVGLANGFLVAKLRLPSFIITFAMAMLVPGFSRALRAFMGALASPALHPENLKHIDDLATIPVFRIVSHDANGAEIVVFPGISWIVIIMVVVAALSHLFLKKTRFGRYAFLVGSNPKASRFSGIKVVRIKILAFVLASMLAGLGRRGEPFGWYRQRRRNGDRILPPLYSRYGPHDDERGPNLPSHAPQRPDRPWRRVPGPETEQEVGGFTGGRKRCRRERNLDRLHKSAD